MSIVVCYFCLYLIDATGARTCGQGFPTKALLCTHLSAVHAVPPADWMVWAGVVPLDPTEETR